MPAIALILVFGLSLIAAPIALNVSGNGLGTMTTLVMAGAGLVISIFAMILIVINKFYKKTVASEALVRTGVGGIHVVLDGGITCIPGFHQLGVVSLRTVRLGVPREGKDSLLTKDKLRADIIAEFFVRVQPTDDAIKTAARSFGVAGVTEASVKALVEDKLVSALRSAASTMTLEELNSNRDSFLKTVTESVKEALDHNGLILETATISKLDQTDAKTLNEHNVFDAQGMRTSAEIVQSNLTERNRLEREGELARVQRDVDTRQKVLASQQTQAQAEAEQAARIAEIQAQQSRLSQEKQIEAQRAVDLAQVEKTRALQVAEMQKQSATEVAEREKQKAIAEADQKVEVAKRAAEEAVAKAEAQRALAEAEKAKAQAALETEKQAITTVEVVATAERQKQQQVIGAQAKADQDLIVAKNKAEAEAYAVERNASARKAAADADAEATTKKATAEANAAKARAEGERANQMIPVDVQKATVEVEQRRVEVLTQELEARAQHGQVGQEFEIAKLRIEADARVRIASAGAMAELMGSVKGTFFGTPEDAAKMTRSFMQGMGLANMAEGFLSGAGPETTAGVEQAVAMIKAVAAKVGVSPEALAGAEKVIEAPKPGAKSTGEGNGKTTD